jgi:hypothetical protein
VIDDILANGRKVYRPEDMGLDEPFIPIEFATAAYRFGHTMVPQKFRVQPGGQKHDVFGTTLGKGFEPLQSADAVIDWSVLLDTGNNNNFECAGEMDAKLASSLLDLPFLPRSLPAFERSLAVRNLLRGQSFLIPSGEQVANDLIDAGAEEVTPDMITDVSKEAKKLGLKAAGTPLWIYLLVEGKEIGRLDRLNAQGGPVFSKGAGLGPVGARLVAEVLIGMLELDERSYLGANRSWTPVDGADKLGANGLTRLYELLTF